MMLATSRTMALLDALANSSSPIGVIELSHALQIHKADVSRILSTLEQTGYVIRNMETAKYTLSFKFIAMALRFRDETRLEDVVRPVLLDLVRTTGESVQFAIQQNGDMIYVEKEEGIKSLRVASMLGRTAPLHATAAGKVWLSSLPEAEAVALLEKRGMPLITSNTITNLADFLEELRHVRERGYAVSREEVNPAVFALAAPVYDRKASVQGALVITLPMYEANQERVETVRVAVMQHADILAERLQMIW